MTAKMIRWVSFVALTLFALEAHSQSDPNATRAFLIKFESDIMYKQSIPGKTCTDTKIKMQTDFVALKYSQESNAYEGVAAITCANFVMGNCASDKKKATRTIDGEMIFRVTPESDSTLHVYYELSQYPEQEWAEKSNDGKLDQVTKGPLWMSYYHTSQSDIRVGDGFEMVGFDVKKDKTVKTFSKVRKKASSDGLSKTSDVTTITLTHVGIDPRNQTQIVK
jgi:hypothetical protein